MMLLRKWKAISPPRLVRICIPPLSFRELTKAARERGRADDGIRTRDLLITNQLLYQLSYVGGSLGE
jgi:hypothetical protein